MSGYNSNDQNMQHNGQNMQQPMQQPIHQQQQPQQQIGQTLGQYNTYYPNNSANGSQAPPMWNPGMPMTFEAWVNKDSKSDQAARIFYSTHAPLQCKTCKDFGRNIRYVNGTDQTDVVYSLCQNCRANNLKMMNMEYVLFKKP